jgi:hypothetical protein
MSQEIARWLRACGLAAVVAAVALGAVAASAGAQDRVYWTESGAGNGFGFAALDGTGGGSLGFESTERYAREGFTIDTADGRIFWDSGGYLIESIKLDGTDQRRFQYGLITTTMVHGLSIDPGGRRLIWSQGAAPAIEVARLDGGGGGGLSTSPGVEVFTGENMPVFDAASGRVYWPAPPNYAAPKTSKVGIGYASIDGSGGGVLPLAEEPHGGLAIDDAAGRIYWVTRKERIMSMNLDGSDPRPLDTGTAPLAKPWGLAIDEATRAIYWTNKGARAISFAKLDGSGEVGQLNLAGAPPGDTVDLALFVAPRLVAAPVVSGAAAPGQTLTCSLGEWTPDQPQAKLFDAPAAFAYQWTRDGAAIPGATAATLTVPAAGAAYACTVTASNGAGTTSASSTALQVPAPPPPVPVGFGAATAVTLALVPGPVHGNALPVSIENFNSFAVTGNLTASAVARRGSRPVTLGVEPFRVGAASSLVATLRLPAPLRKRLVAEGTLKLKLAATVADPLGTRREVAAVAAAKAKHHKAKRAKPRHHRKLPRTSANQLSQMKA